MKKTKSMKSIATLLVALFATTILTSCMNDSTGSAHAGFTPIAYTRAFANTTQGYLEFASYGDWRIDQKSGSSWLSLDRTSGTSYVVYRINAAFQMNNSSEARQSQIHLYDVANPDNGYVDFVISQYGVRGDGSAGNAAVVKKITGTDGSVIDLEYDNLYRVNSIKMTKSNTVLSDLKFVFLATDTTLQVNNGSGEMLKAKYTAGYQPDVLISSTDTVGLTVQSSNSTVNAVFNVGEYKKNEQELMAYFFANQAQAMGDPDAEHKADSVTYYHNYANGTKVVERMGMKYSDVSNKFQTVDANKLILGIEKCNPYMLLSLYRYGRSTKIVSEAVASDGSGKYIVSTTLNNNKSIKTMTVTDKKGNDITYTFEYEY